MALSDPFSTTYQGSFQAGQSLGQGLNDAAGSFADKINKQKQQKQAFDMLKQVGMVDEKTEDPSIDQLSKGLQEYGKQHGKDVQINYGDDEVQARRNITGIYKALGIPMPQGKTTTKLNLAPGTTYEPVPGLSFSGTKPVDPMVQEMRASRLQQQSNNEQDRLEQNAMQRVSNLRGDASLANIEKQRDAAIQAYTSIKHIKSQNRMPSQAEYYDMLGQIWKAKTGAAPTNEVIADLDAKTMEQKIAKVIQYWGGKTQGMTTENLLNNFEDFVTQTGKQTDVSHDAYMKPHMIKPKGLSEDRWENIKNQTRGQSFQEAIQSTDNPGKGVTDVSGLTSKSNSGKNYIQQGMYNGRRVGKLPDGTTEYIDGQ